MASLIVLVSLLLIAGLIFALIQLRSPNYDKDGYQYQRLQSSLKDPVPKDPAAKSEYYNQIAMNYTAIGDTKASLNALLEADKALTDRSVASGLSYNVAIAGRYKELGKIQDAKKYYDREIKRIANSPEAAQNQEPLQYLRKQVAEL